MRQSVCIVGTLSATYQRIADVKTFCRPCEAQAAPACQPARHRRWVFHGIAGRAPWSWYAERAAASELFARPLPAGSGEEWSE